jgi:purine-binding chemotaxis protein CheW
MAKILDAKMIAGFAQEIQSYLPKIRQGIASFGADANQQEALQEALRYVHTIKGASAMVGLSVLSQVTAAIEETLEEIADGHYSINAERSVWLGQTVDHIENNLEGLLSGTVCEETIVTAITQLLQRCLGLEETSAVPTEVSSPETETVLPADCWVDAWDADEAEEGTVSEAPPETGDAEPIHTPEPAPPAEVATAPVETETTAVSEAFEMEEELTFSVLIDAVEAEIEEEAATSEGQNEPPSEAQQQAETPPVTPGALDALIDAIDSEVQQVYGQGVTARVQRTSLDGESTSERYLLFTLAGCRYAVSVPNVIEVGRVPAITPVPNVPVWLRGVINLRGEILSIIDVRVFLGIDEGHTVESSRMLVVKSVRDEIVTSLIVDQVNGFARFSKARLETPAIPVQDKITPYISAVCEHEEHIVAVLDLERLLLSPEVCQFDEA